MQRYKLRNSLLLILTHLHFPNKIRKMQTHSSLDWIICLCAMVVNQSAVWNSVYISIPLSLLIISMSHGEPEQSLPDSTAGVSQPHSADTAGVLHTDMISYLFSSFTYNLNLIKWSRQLEHAHVVKKRKKKKHVCKSVQSNTHTPCHR